MKNVRPFFRNSREDKDGMAKWHAFIGNWWRLCKDNDERTADAEAFSARWKDLTGLLDVHLQNNPTLIQSHKTAVEHMARLFDLRKKWAASYTWHLATRGMHSTQRCESLHSALKSRLSKNPMLSDLVDQISDYADKVEDMSHTKYFRDVLRTAAKGDAVPSWMQQVQKLLTPYAYDLVLGQYRQHVQYAVHPQENERGHYCVRRQYAEHEKVYDLEPVVDGSSTFSGKRAAAISSAVTMVDFGLRVFQRESDRIATADSCTCQHLSSWLLPCRHMLAVWIYERRFHSDEGFLQAEPLFHHFWRALAPDLDSELWTGPAQFNSEDEDGTAPPPRLRTREERYAAMRTASQQVCINAYTTLSDCSINS